MKGLEALERLGNVEIWKELPEDAEFPDDVYYLGDLNDYYSAEYETIKRELKALEILKQHICLNFNDEGKVILKDNQISLSQEEQNLLKEVLKND